MSDAFGGRSGAGARPALVIVDMSRGFTDSSSALACDADDALEATARLAQAARRTGAPVIYTTVAYGPGDFQRARTFLAKVPALAMLEAGSDWTRIDDRVAPRSDETILVKLFASAFFDTPLAGMLRTAGVDTVVVAGLSTSGCVRATVVDALQHGFRPLVARETVGDRDRHAAAQALKDINDKYGDVLPLADALGAFAAPIKEPA